MLCNFGEKEAMDQKKLRELTKQEKARRGPGQGTAVASVLKRKQEAAAKAEMAKRAKAEAAKMLPPAVPKTAGADSKAPEEAEVPEAKDAEQIPAAEKESAEPAEEEEDEAEQQEAIVGPLVAPAESQQLKATGTVSAEPAEAPKAAVAEAEEGQDDQVLPEGFFDDPELDAKVRGMEAPSRKAEREIEEGLRRFEREMAAEQEKAEETRHAIDEKKYEALAAEEEEFQTQLESRLVKLRQAASERKKGMDGADAPVTGDPRKQLHQKLSSQDGLKKTIDSFRSELGEWDRERRDHEHLLNEKTCLQENELSALRKMILGLKNVGDLIAATKDEVTQLREYCCERVDVNRDKIMKLRDEIESKFAASESTQFKLHDDVTNMATVFAHLKSEMERIGLVTAETMESLADLWRAKASASSVEEQQQTFIEFQRNLNDAVAALRLRVNSVVDEVKDHFQTAAGEIFCTGDPGGLGAGHLTGVFKEVWCQTEERDAMHAIVESQLIAAEMNVQDDQDRKNVALFGCKPEKGDRDGLLPNIDQTPRKKEVKTASPIISLDKRCLSCCSNTGTVLAGFKIACLNYTPGSSAASAPTETVAESAEDDADDDEDADMDFDWRAKGFG
eukprot:s98_g14.t1